MSNVLVNENVLYDIADYIREKKGESNTYFPNEFRSKLDSIPSGGGGDERDPVVYRANHRNPNYPYIPLPSEMKDENSPYYEANDCIYELYYAGDEFCCPAYQVAYTGSATCAVLKYNNTQLVKTEHVTVNNNVETYLQYTKDDADYNTYNYILVKINGNIKNVQFNIKPRLNNIPFNNFNCQGLIEVSGKTDSTKIVNNLQHAYKLEYFSFIGNVTSMNDMFLSCYSLQAIPQLDTSNVTSMQNMFYNCYSLQTIPQLDTSRVVNMTSMFYNCYSLQTIPQLNTPNVTDMYSMFYNCYSLQTIPQLDTSNVSGMQNMFNNCYSLQTIPQLNTPNVIGMDYMFNNCYSLQAIPQLDTSKVANMTFMFYNCYSLQAIPQLDTSKVTGMGSMFNNCYSLQTIPQLDTSKVTRMGNMFNGCHLLNITISYFNMSSTTYTSSMFSNNYLLKNVIIREFGTNYVLNTNAFSGCYHILGTKDSTYNPDGLKDGYIYVPDDMVDVLKANTNWATVASQIRPISELEG